MDIVLLTLLVIIAGFFAWVPTSKWVKKNKRKKAEEVIDCQDEKAKNL